MRSSPRYDCRSRYITGRQLPDKAVDCSTPPARASSSLHSSKPAALDDTGAIERSTRIAALEREWLAARPRRPAAGDHCASAEAIDGAGRRRSARSRGIARRLADARSRLRRTCCRRARLCSRHGRDGVPTSGDWTREAPATRVAQSTPCKEARARSRWCRSMSTRTWSPRSSPTGPAFRVGNMIKDEIADRAAHG